VEDLYAIVSNQPGKPMTTRSRYDELHDRYHAILTTKAGTRYEMLAALVFKALEEKNTVIHDIKLVGASDVAHQIDVTVETNGSKRRVVIECKDYDISGDKIGLDIIRSFRSVLEDTDADEGIVITCNGFTSEAQKFAKAKDIKLVILRKFEEADMQGRIKTVVVNLIVQAPKAPTVTLSLSAENQRLMTEECQRIGIQGGVSNTDAVFFVRASERVQFNEFLSARMREATTGRWDAKRHDVTVSPDGWALQVERGPLIAFDAIVITFEMDEQRHQIQITSDRIAELILSGFGAADIIIFGDQLERKKIDPETGEIH
jgi:hypothetical protein